MSDCNATIQMGDETLGCNDCFAPVDAHAHRWLSDDETTTVVWNDAASGATPHRDPAPRYRALRKESIRDCWFVTDENVNDPDVVERGVAMFRNRHPDPRRAAEAEAARLNGEGPDEGITHTVYQELYTARDDRDRYRHALSRIVQEEGRKGQNCDGDCSHGCRSSMKSFHLALHALEGRP